MRKCDRQMSIETWIKFIHELSICLVFLSRTRGGGKVASLQVLYSRTVLKLVFQNRCQNFYSACKIQCPITGSLFQPLTTALQACILKLRVTIGDCQLYLQYWVKTQARSWRRISPRKYGSQRKPVNKISPKRMQHSNQS